ncbi:2-hydroxyacid dehydrogenase [Pantoea agglomerans]|uniref:2-hydroxyacid dehydrogenase n=1 Tax=Enterobacter agglomerans TaxID=549 RepID=UPI002449C648|nr:2-hydroxyacid dehydrogenase [Pantoea agglomerans]MDH1170458.1 2-hydroxyacid dehydrogenase [Pantoea agglomerans]
MPYAEKTSVLLIAPVMDALYEKLIAAYQVCKLYEESDAQSFLKEKGDQFRAIITRGDTGVKTEILEKLPSLGLIAVFGVGTDAIDLTYTRQHDIAVTITSGILTSDVADMAIGLMLSGARNLCQGDRFVRSRAWESEAPPLGSQVSGKRLGIVGMGNIGQAIARRALAFDMHISYNSRSKKEALPYTWQANLLSLARESDFLVITASGGAHTKNLINSDVIAAMPAHAWLVNIARGSMVDEPALIDAVQSNKIAGAALDVFASEPNVSEAWLALENVVLQPHVGSATHETRQKMCESVLASVDAFFTGKTLPSQVRGPL